MSVATPDLTKPAAQPDLLHEPRTSLLTLTKVELRKSYDTRAGFWLLATLGLIVVAMVLIIGLAGNDEDRTFENFLRAIQWPVSLLLPVIAILLVTSEWSQRSALTTFTLVPNRWRVIVAKALAMLALTGLTMALAHVAAAVGTALGGADDAWSYGLDTLGEVVVFQLQAVLTGFAFGLVFLSSPLAIVLYFVLPIVWSILVNSIPGLDDVAEWLDPGTTMMPLLEDEGVSSGDWARIGASLALWFLVPLAIGLWRLSRAEVK